MSRDIPFPSHLDFETHAPNKAPGKGVPFGLCAALQLIWSGGGVQQFCRWEGRLDAPDQTGALVEHGALLKGGKTASGQEKGNGPPELCSWRGRG